MWLAEQVAQKAGSEARKAADQISIMVVSSLQARYGKLRRFVIHNLLHADDPPHRLALGLAVGVFVAFTPTVGIQMIIAGFLSWLLKANKLVSAAMVWISNPATIIPIYWYCYRIGCAVLALDPIGRDWWLRLAEPPQGWWNRVTFYWTQFLAIAEPLWLGGLIVGLICAYPTYYVAFAVIRAYRQRRAARDAHAREEAAPVNQPSADVAGHCE